MEIDLRKFKATNTFEHKPGIYIFTFPDRKQYVGIAKDMKVRINNHFRKNYVSTCDQACHIYKREEINIKVFYAPKEELDELERAAIKKLNTKVPNGHNLTTGGHGLYQHHDLTKEKISKIVKEYFKRHPEVIELRNSLMNSPEYKEKFSKISKLAWADQEYRDKILKAIKDRAEDPAWREKISKSVKKNYEDPEYGERLKKIIKASYEDPIVRERVGKAVKDAFDRNPEIKQKMSSSQKKRFEDPEKREIMKEKSKAYWIEHPDELKKRSEAISLSLKTPEIREKISKGVIASQTKEYKEKLSKSLKDLHNKKHEEKVREKLKLIYKDPEELEKEIKKEMAEWRAARDIKIIERDKRRQAKKLAKQNENLLEKYVKKSLSLLADAL